jgi:hypothetical protein
MSDQSKDTNEELEDWKATRLIDERSGNSCIGIDFPRRQREPGFEVFDDDLAEQPQRVRSLLKSRGAAFTGTKKDQIEFVRRLLRNMPPKALTLAMKPGLRGRDGFVLGKVMLGTAKDRFRWRPQATSDSGEIGDRAGSDVDWEFDVGDLALKSSFLTFGLCVPLACPLPSYVLANSQQRLLSETAVFNFSGESGSGKTSIVRAAAGVFGPPGLLRKWDFTRRGLEEEMESRNDLLAVFDDVETHTEEASLLRTALRNMNQIPTSGQSKLLSQHAGLSFLQWMSFGLTTSAEPIDVLAERLNWKRTDGQRARFIDIPVPKVEQAGIVDRLRGDALDKIQQGKKLIDELDLGVTQNYGVLMPRFLNVLFAEDHASFILKRRDIFLQRILSNGDGFDERYAVKFAIPAAAGYLAAVREIVPWPKMWPYEAAERCYYLAVKAVRKDADVAAKKLRLLAKLAANSHRFIAVKWGASQVIRLGDESLGIRTTYRDREVLAIRDETLETFAGSRKVADLLLGRLRNKNILLGGHGHAGTTQLPTPIQIDGKTIRKPRFWIIDLKRLAAANI